MVIDCHGHYTTAPTELEAFRQKQIVGLSDPSQKPSKGSLNISDDQIRESLEKAQLKLQRERGTDLTIFSPRAAGMAHHIGDATTSLHWAQACNDLIHRCVTLYPENFVGVCQLPQSPGVPPKNCMEELARCVKERGFVGCNLNPDPSGGYWKDPPLSDQWWYPLYEKMVELDVPAMIHASASCNPNFHTTGGHYINGDTTAFMQLITADLFKDFPTLKVIIPRARAHEHAGTARRATVHARSAPDPRLGDARPEGDAIRPHSAERQRDESVDRQAGPRHRRVRHHLPARERRGRGT